MDLERLPLDLGDVAADAMPSLTQLAAARNVRIVLRPQAPDGAYVVTSGDAALVAGEQVVTLTLRALG